MWEFILSDVLLFCSVSCSCSCYVAGSNCWILRFSLLVGIDACKVVYTVLYMVWDIQRVVMGVVYVLVEEGGRWWAAMDGFQLGTVHAHGIFIGLPHWHTRPPRPWTSFLLRHILLTLN